MKEDVTYYERRAAEEQAASEGASNAAAAIAHGKLAQQYAALAEKRQSLRSSIREELANLKGNRFSSDHCGDMGLGSRLQRFLPGSGGR